MHTFFFVLAALTTLGGGFSTLGVGERGEVASLREGASGRELLGVAAPMVTLVTRDGARVEATSARMTGANELTYDFAGRDDSVTLVADAFHGGWTFCVTRAALREVKLVEFCRLNPVCTNYCGKLVNGLSDERSGVVLRAYDVETKMRVTPTALWVEMRGDEALVGRRFGLAAGARSEIPQMLRGMTLAAGLAHSDTGGAWSLGAEGNRSSFFMVRNPSDVTMDDWIDCAKLCGCTTLHIDWWWEPNKTEGHYRVDTKRFPRGFADLRDASLKAHAAGLKTDTHTLSGCIGFDDPWVTPHASSNLMHVYSYTLARPLGTADDVVYVNEKPGPRHDYTLAYSSNGNVLRIGTELLQYTGISFEKPYAFTGVTRGAFKTEVFAHAAGVRADYLWQHYLEFFAEPYSPLSDELAATLGEMYSSCGFDQVYMDGAEGVANAMGVPDERKRDRQLRQIFSAFAAKGNAPLWEDSTWTTHGWWFHSRIGSWDYASWAPRTFVNRHIRRLLPQSRLENFLEPSLGWWPIKWGWSETRCYHLDEQEYFAAKMAGVDSAFSITPWYESGPEKHPFAISERAAMTIIGTYERFRLARAFAPGVRQRLAAEGSDFRLRQGADGAWALTPVRTDLHTVVGPETSAWTVRSAGARACDLRVEALEGAGAWEGRHETAISACDVGQMKCTSAAGVTFACSADEGSNGVRLSAANANATKRGAWTCAMLEFAHPFTNRTFAGCLAYRLRVKGDGSGALLNVQTGQGRAAGGGLNERYIRLDFTGWREFELPLNREHDAAAFDTLVWPYERGAACYSVYERGIVRAKQIGSLALWLNEVPAGGKTEVVVGEVRAVPVLNRPIRQAVVTVNGGAIRVPFELKSGEFADLTGDFWTHYSMRGEPIARVRAAGRPSWKEGVNELSFAAAANGAPRAEVTTFARGEAFAALAPVLSPDQEKMLVFEADLPQIWAPSKGFDTLEPVRVRPGKTAAVEVEIVGPVRNPVLTLGTRRVAIPVTVAASEKLVVRGASWRVRAPKGVVRTQGELAAPLPDCAGVTAFSLASEDEASAFAQVRLFKHYP